jgi:hypothetical protein
MVGAGLTAWMLLVAYEGLATSSFPAANYGFIAVFIIALLIYPAIRSYRRRQGMDLSHLFADIPPE